VICVISLEGISRRVVVVVDMMMYVRVSQAPIYRQCPVYPRHRNSWPGLRVEHHRVPVTGGEEVGWALRQ
jgi:hypothetical protein